MALQDLHRCRQGGGQLPSPTLSQHNLREPTNKLSHLIPNHGEELPVFVVCLRGCHLACLSSFGGKWEAWTRSPGRWTGNEQPRVFRTLGGGSRRLLPIQFRKAILGVGSGKTLQESLQLRCSGWGLNDDGNWAGALIPLSVPAEAAIWTELCLLQRCSL